MDLDPLWQEAFATTLTSTAQKSTTSLGLHAGTEAKLAFARAFRGLIGALHVVKFLKDRVGENVEKVILCQTMIQKIGSSVIKEKPLILPETTPLS